MPARLERKLATLRGTIRRILIVRGVCWVLFAAIASYLALSWADWMMPLTRDVRAAGLVGAVALLGWTTWRTLIRPLSVPLDDLRLARRLERLWPELADRLSTTVHFLRLERQGIADDRAGSSQLRSATVEQTLGALGSLDFSRLLDRRPTRLAVSLAAYLLAYLGLSTALAPEFQRIAVRRLALSDVAWPQSRYLRLVDPPTKVARGDSVELKARLEPGSDLPVVPPREWLALLARYVPPFRLVEEALRSEAPTSAVVHVEMEDGDDLADPMQADQHGGFHGRLESAGLSFRYQVRAGDLRTDWGSVAVVPPPALDEVALRLRLPRYTRPYLPDDRLDELVRGVQPGLSRTEAVLGSEWLIDARANKPLDSVVLNRNDVPSGVAVELAEDGRSLAARVPVDSSASYWFGLVDRDGFANKEAIRYELRAVPDAPPRIALVRPTADQTVRPDATVPVALTIEDDFGVQLVRLVYSIKGPESEETREGIIPLWASEPSIDDGTRTAVRAAHSWALAGLALRPGEVVTFHAEARDFFSSADGSLGPNLTQSRPIRLRVVDDEEYRRQIDDRRREIREEIERALDVQRQASAATRQVATTLEATGRLEGEDREALNDASINQQQVGSRVAGSVDSLRTKLAGLAEDLERSGLGDAELQDQVDQMRATVEQLDAENLKPAEQALARADRATEPAADAPADGQSEPAADPAAAKESLAEAARNQQAIEQALQGMLEGLSQFDSLRGVTKDAEAILERQDQAIEATTEAAADPELTGKLPDELADRERAGLENLADQQRDVGRELNDLARRMGEMAERMEASDPMAAAALREAVEQLEQRGTTGRMTGNAEQIARNQLGGARQGQQQTKKDLQDLVEGLKNRRESDLARIAKQLAEAEAELKQARDAQAALLRKTQQARQAQQAGGDQGEQLQQLAKEQEEVEQKVRSQLQRLQKMRAEAAARAGARAAGKMGEAGEQLDEDEAEEAEARQEEALRDLDEAVAETEQARRRAEERLLMEQFAKVRDRLRGLSERQAQINAETLEYDRQRLEAGGRLTRPQSLDVRGLSRVQEGVQGETEVLGEDLAGAPVFKLALERAVGSMGRAAEGLDRADVGEPTQAAERDASRWFDQLIEALRPPKDEQGGQQGGQQGGGGGGGGGGGDGIPTEAQIRMLKTLQEDVNARTAALDPIQRQGDLTPDQEAELTRLETDQRNIADLLRDIVQPKRPDGLED